MKEWRTTREVAALLKITPGRVRQLAQATSVGVRMSRDWMFAPEDVEALRQRNTQRGRPVTKEDSPEA